MIRLNLFAHPETNIGEKMFLIVRCILLAEKVMRFLENSQYWSHYKRYTLLGGHKMKSDNYTFSLLAVSGTTRVENKKLIYPISSLMVEFFGTLSLFLGLSFISLWDNIDILKKLLAF